LVKPRSISRRGLLALLAGAALTGPGSLGDASALGDGRKIVREAKKHIGERYVAGGTGPDKFDCSGFTHYVVQQALGRNITPDLRGQTRVGRRVSTNRRHKGDLIFFSMGKGRRVTHVAIVSGKNRVIHAMNPKDGVRSSNISSAYYQKNIHSVRRL
jgi:cell wall-associated NlpC family hydrolase